jgi:hypothetical protein
MTKDAEAGLSLTAQVAVFFQDSLQGTDNGHCGTETRFSSGISAYPSKSAHMKHDSRTTQMFLTTVCTYETRQSDHTNFPNNCLSHTKRELNSDCRKSHRIVPA